MNHHISPRELEILHLVAYEHNTKEIAKELFISEHTVISHRKNLLLKMDAKNTAGLVRKAFEHKFLKVNQVLSYSLALFLLIFNLPSINSVEAQELLEVESGITISESISEIPVEGTIRWNKTKEVFQGFNGSTWVNFSEPGGWGKPLFSYVSETEIISNDSIHEFGKIMDMGSGGKWIVIGDDNNNKVHFLNTATGIMQTRSRPNVSGFGETVAIDSITAVVGTYSGEVFVFERDVNNIWNLKQKLPGPAGGVYLRTGLDLEGQHIVCETGSTDLRSYVYSNSTWDQQFSTISSSNGSNLVFPKIHKDRLVATDDNGTGEAFYVFEYSGALWNQIAYLQPSNGDSIYNSSLSIYDDRVLGCSPSGNCYLFTQTNTGWEETILTPKFDGVKTDLLGATIMSKDYIVIADPFCPAFGDKVCHSGLLHVYHFDGVEWALQTILATSDTTDNVGLGFSRIAMNNNKIAASSWTDGIFIFKR